VGFDLKRGAGSPPFVSLMFWRKNLKGYTYTWKADFPPRYGLFLVFKRLFILFILHNCLKNSYAKLKSLVVPVLFKLITSSWTKTGHDGGIDSQILDIYVLLVQLGPDWYICTCFYISSIAVQIKQVSLTN